MLDNGDEILQYGDKVILGGLVEDPKRFDKSRIKLTVAPLCNGIGNGLQLCFRWEVEEICLIDGYLWQPIEITSEPSSFEAFIAGKTLLVQQDDLREKLPGKDSGFSFDQNDLDELVPINRINNQ